MLYGNSNILAVITRGISSGFSGVVDVCWFFICGF